MTLLFFSALFLAAGDPGPVAAAPLPVLAAQDALGPQLLQVRRFAEVEGEAMWAGYGAAPFEFLLVESSVETLLCRTSVPAGFAPAGADKVTGCARFTRARTPLSDGLLAAMPLFGPPATIVMGTPETTGRTPASWLRTILHEHFHQWQFSLPDYFNRTGALDLKGGDESGMWVLNYPFPYERADVIAAQATASNALAEAVAARGTPEFKAKLGAYLAKRSVFRSVVSEKDWRYIDFQLWQEGVARWTEIELGKAYPDEAVAQSAVKLEQRTLDELRKPDLAGQKREFVYAYGAAEAMLLEACSANWRQQYLTQLALGPLLNDIGKGCAGRSE